MRQSLLNYLKQHAESLGSAPHIVSTHQGSAMRGLCGCGIKWSLCCSDILRPCDFCQFFQACSHCSGLGLRAGQGWGAVALGVEIGMDRLCLSEGACWDERCQRSPGGRLGCQLSGCTSLELSAHHLRMAWRSMMAHLFRRSGT